MPWQLAEDLPGQPADMNGGNSDIDAVIYEWRDGGFVELRRLRSHGAEDAEFFHIGARAFLAIACIRSGRGPYAMNTRPLLFEWREGRFVEFQELASFAAKPQIISPDRGWDQHSAYAHPYRTCIESQGPSR